MLQKIKASILQVLRILDNATENLPDGSAGDIKAVMISGGELRKMERVLEDVDDMIADMIKYESEKAVTEETTTETTLELPVEAIELYERLVSVGRTSQSVEPLAMRIAAKVAFGIEV